MTKKKISAALLAGLILVSLAGCAEHKEPIQIAPNSTATADGTSDIQLSDDISAKPAVPADCRYGDFTATGFWSMGREKTLWTDIYGYIPHHIYHQ